MKTAKDEIRSLLFDLGVFRSLPCTDDENKQFYKLKKEKQWQEEFDSGNDEMVNE